MPTKTASDGVAELRLNKMMAHLLDALDRGEDIGHYGRLVFAMIARHFIDEEELCSYLAKNPEFSEDEARALCKQVEARDYNLPRREKILQWQKEQEFPICPDDGQGCNIYSDLALPPHIFQKIEQFYEEKA